MIYYSNTFPLTAVTVVELHTVVFKVRNKPQKVSRAINHIKDDIISQCLKFLAVFFVVLILLFRVNHWKQDNNEPLSVLLIAQRDV